MSSGCRAHCPLSIPVAPLPDLSHFSRFDAMSDAEAGLIRATATNTEKQLEAVEKQMLELQLSAKRILWQLAERRKELQDSLRAQKSLLAPIRKLPVEVLGEIFLLAERSPRKDFDLSERATISRVCAGWRAVATSTPALWLRIELLGRPPSRASISQELEWSGTHPLSILYNTLSDEDEDQWAFDLIVAEAHRWRDVRLLLSQKDLEFLSSASRDFPLLERLDFAQLGQLYPSRQALPPLSFDSTHCPLLRDVLFQPEALPAHPAAIPITWSQIQRCTVMTSTDTVLPTLRLLSANVGVAEIKRFHVFGSAVIDDLEWYLGEEPIHMPHLIELKIDDVRSGGRHALEFIRAPAMQSLVLVDGSGANASLTAFVAQSRCALTRLHLKTPLDTSELVRALEQVPNVVNLSLEGLVTPISMPAFDEEFFAAMSDTRLVPAVTHLSLTGWFHRQCPVESAFPMLRARNYATGAGQLRSFEFRVREESDSKYEKLLALEDEGLMIFYYTIKY
uniref:F-box domain-containing protein n=1 Tax=Mycena chlorophos TaxID=658473 RepID=A0ABQ0L611_MYCCL|nr:predicted protein [Mycena chlorophos]